VRRRDRAASRRRARSPAARGRFAPAACAALLLAAAACGPGSGDVPPAGDAGPIPACAELRLEEPRRRPLVVILADTLRRDRLGAYGGPARTPHFDAFAAANRLFTRAASQSPWTKPAMATLFTGLYPSSHGVVSHPELRGAEGEALESDALGPDAVTLAEDLAAAGYRTAAFVSNPWLQAELGFDQGFQTFDDSFASNATPGPVVSRAGLRWLEAHAEGERPYFLYLHYMDPHAPYPPVSRERMREELERIRSDERSVPPHVARSIARQARDPRGVPWVRRGVPATLALLELVYDQGVERFDAALGLFLEGFREIPGSEEAAVVVVSDHGEALFHRGWRGHGFGLYEDEIGVPLAARLPGVAGPQTVGCPVGLVDLRRTLCDYLGLDCPGPDQGTSLLDPEGGRYLLVEGVKGKPGNRALRNARYKLIHRPDGPPPNSRPAAAARRALYDLVRDPEETGNLLAGGGGEEARAVAGRLERALRETLAGLTAEAGTRTVPLDATTRERLEALGYLGREPGGAPAGSD